MMEKVLPHKLFLRSARASFFLSLNRPFPGGNRFQLRYKTGCSPHVKVLPPGLHQRCLSEKQKIGLEKSVWEGICSWHSQSFKALRYFSWFLCQWDLPWIPIFDHISQRGRDGGKTGNELSIIAS